MAVTDTAIERIKELIVTGQLAPGARLPREADLAADLGVSRNSLREAVRALSLVRVLEVRQGDGTYVSSLEPELMLDTLGFLLDFHQDSSVLHVLGVRRILEPAATALAAIHRTDSSVRTLSDTVAAGAELTSVNELIAHDLEFHHMVAGQCGNPVLSSMLDSLALPTVRARVWRGVTDASALDRTIAEHAAIVDAIADRDFTLAAARATVHIAGVEDWLRKNQAV